MDIVAETPTWYALRVKLQGELHAVTMLSQRGYEAFTPYYKTAMYPRGKAPRCLKALFSGYAFCRFDANIGAKIVTTPGVLGIVSFNKKPASIPNDQIEALKAVMKSTLALQPWPFMRPGQNVELYDGPLRGVRGQIVTASDGCSLVISVDILNRSLAVSINRNWARLIDISERDNQHSAQSCVKAGACRNEHQV